MFAMMFETHPAVAIATSTFADRSLFRGRAAIVDQMADDMRVAAASAEAATEAGLLLLGWTPAQIREHGDAAARTARRRSARRAQ